MAEPRSFKAHAVVKADRACRLEAADDGDHLAFAYRFVAGNQVGQQAHAVTVALPVGIDVDRIFQREPVGQEIPERGGIGISLDPAASSITRHGRPRDDNRWSRAATSTASGGVSSNVATLVPT